MIAIFFDGDQTLWDFQALMRRALSATIGELRSVCPGIDGDLSVAAFVADRDRAVEQMKGDGSTLEEIRRHAFRLSLRRLGIDDERLGDYLNRLYLDRRFAAVDLYPDVLPALEALAGRYRVGLLSNGNSYPDRVGLHRSFEAEVFAQQVGASKPDRRIYAAAEQSLPADRYVMVGDSLRDDVAGAQAVGWAAVWLNRLGVSGDHEITPDQTLIDLRGLEPWLQTLH